MAKRFYLTHTQFQRITCNTLKTVTIIQILGQTHVIQTASCPMRVLRESCDSLICIPSQLLWSQKSTLSLICVTKKKMRKKERERQKKRDDSHPRYVNVKVIGTESRATTFELTATSGERRLRHAPWNVGPCVVGKESRRGKGKGKHLAKPRPPRIRYLTASRRSTTPRDGGQ